MKLNAGSLNGTFLVLYPLEGRTGAGKAYVAHIPDHDTQWAMYCNDVALEIVEENAEPKTKLFDGEVHIAKISCGDIDGYFQVKEIENSLSAAMDACS